MKKIITLLFICFLSISGFAQTFEKIIKSPYQDFSSEVIVNHKDEILVVIKNFNLAPSSPRFLNSSFVLLNPDGTTKNQLQLTGQDFGLTLDTIYSYLHTLSGKYRNEKYLFYASNKVDTPSVYSRLFFELDSNLNITRYSHKDTLNRLFMGYSRMKENGSNVLLTGFDYNYSNGIFNGRVGLLNDSLDEISKVMFNTSDTVFMEIIDDGLIDQQKQIYLFGEGKLSNSFSGSPMQLIKLDSSFNLIKKQYIRHPLLSGWEHYLSSGLSISAFWISDTTFLLATTGAIEYNLKGDIHFFVYDTAFNQLKYKRIITPDTSEFNNEFKTTTYDSLCDCFYMGVTKRFENFNSPTFGTDDTTDFQLIKFDKDLNIIFNRFYRRNRTLTFAQLKTDSKGNVIMVGQTQDINSPNPSNTDIFILKVDSNGNLLSTAIKENEEIDPLNYSIFPNPVTDAFTFRQYNVIENYTMQLYDSNAKLQMQFEVKNSEDSFSIQDLSRGVYIYQLTNSKGKQRSGKLIKK